MTPAKKKEKYLGEKLAAVKVRQNKTMNWLKNEELFNQVQQPTLLTRSNLLVPKVFEGVNTVASRIGKMPDVDYEVKPQGDDNASDIMKNLWQYDVRVSNLEHLANLSKTECGIYGRAVFKLIPSNDGMKIDLVDTLSFLISPIARSIDTAQYCGQDFIYKTYEQLEDEAGKFGYDELVLKKLKKIPSEKQEEAGEEASKRNSRLSSLGFTNVTELGSKVLRETEWGTTIDGKKTLQTWINDEYLLREIPLSDTGLETWPFESFATFPRAVIFWVLAVADVLRDPTLALTTIVNQIIDNNTYRNFGMLFVGSSSGLKQSSINPRPLGVQQVSLGVGEKISDKVWQNVPPEISTASATYQLVNSIAEAAAGMGLANLGNRGKRSVSEIAKEMAAIEEMTNSMRQSYMLCFQNISQRYANFISKKLTTPRNVKMFGQKPTTIEGVTSKNFEGLQFISTVTPAESIKENKAIKQKARMEFFDRMKDKPFVNQLELGRLLAKEVEISATEQERLFTQDQQQGQPQQGQPGQPQPGQQPGQPQPGQPNIPQNGENPQLSANGQMTAANLPNQIRA